MASGLGGGPEQEQVVVCWGGGGRAALSPRAVAQSERAGLGQQAQQLSISSSVAAAA